ncbi:hypothetical protein [Streptomyces cacaoi]|uniref:hypothetical protein n=1 Tax=Streptomyces cacaoi TaxID=1898 RepID=UPI003748C021
MARRRHDGRAPGGEAGLVEENGGRCTAGELSRSHLDTALEHRARAELSPAAATEPAALFDRVIQRGPTA